MRVRTTVLASTLLVTASLAPACRVAPDPITVARDRISLVNQTDEDWTGVQMRVNAYYLVEASSLGAHARLDVPIDRLQAGIGRYFDRKREQVRKVEVTAHTRSGAPVSLTWPK